MKGTVKFFDSRKRWGFITDENGEDHFVHHSSILMENGRKQLSEGDIVEFEVGQGANGKEQAVNVQPVLTMMMAENALKEENLCLQTMKDAHGVKKYLVVDGNNAIQTSEQGMTLIEVAAFAGIDVSGLEKHEEEKKL